MQENNYKIFSKYNSKKNCLYYLKQLKESIVWMDLTCIKH